MIISGNIKLNNYTIENKTSQLLFYDQDNVPTIRFGSDPSISLINDTYAVGEKATITLGYSSAYSYLENLLPGSNKAKCTIGTVNNDGIKYETMTLVDGFIGIGNTGPTQKIDVNGNVKCNFINISSYTPSGSADSQGQVGDLTWDTNFFYVKTTSGWLRSNLNAF